MKKRILSLLLTLCLLLGLLPTPALAAGLDTLSARAVTVSPKITLAPVSECLAHWGGNVNPTEAYTSGSSSMWSRNTRGSYDNGTVRATSSGATASIYLKERGHFKEADYLLQPFTVSVGEVPPYTTYLVEFKISCSLKRNSKGNTWCFAELTSDSIRSNNYHEAWDKLYSTNADLKDYSYPFIVRFVTSSGSWSGSRTCILSFSNSTASARNVDLPLALLVGNSMSTSLLTSYHHQMETTLGLTAQKVTVSKNIIYDSNGGSSVSSKLSSADTVTLADAPKRTGYTFTGWKDKDSGKIYQAGATYTGSHGVSLVAQWQADTYTVTLNANGGNLSGDSKTVTYGSPYGELPTPVKTGCTFLGWFTAASGGTQVTSTTTVTRTANHTLYAQWQQNFCAVTFDANYTGGRNSSRTVSQGVALGALPTAARTGYGFNGWFDAKENGAKIDANTPAPAASAATYYAQWTPNTYTVTLNKGDGSGDTLNVTYDGAYTGLTDPARTGYTFAGWWTAASGGTRVTADTKVTRAADHTLYARWTRDTYTITLNPNGGGANTTRSVGTGDKLGDLPTPARTGYTFTGWYTAASGGAPVNADTIPTASATYYAQWTANTYTVTLNKGDGTSERQTVSYDGTYGSLPTPARTGYEFKGWYTAASGGTQVTSSTKVNKTASHTLYARWTAKTYTVSFNAANGGTNPASQTVIFGSAYGALPTPTNTGKNFVGWTLNSSPVTADTIVATAGDHTLTAQWANKHLHKVDPKGTEVEFGTKLTADMVNNSASGGTYTLSGGDYYLDGDITTTNMISIASGETVNLCLNGHTIANTNTSTDPSKGGSSYVIDVFGEINICDCQGGGVIDGTQGPRPLHIGIGATGSLYGGTLKGGNVTTVYVTSGTLTVDGGTITGKQAMDNTSGTVTIKSGTITSSALGVYSVGEKAKLTVEGGTITGGYGIINNNGAVTVSGGTITGSENGLRNGSTGGTFTVSGGAFGGSKGDILMWAPNILDVGENFTGTYSVTCGKPSEQFTPMEILAEPTTTDYSAHFTAADDGFAIRSVEKDGKFQVELYRPHVHDGVEFEPLTADRANALTSGSYYLTGDMERNTAFTITNGAKVNLCLNGHTLTCGVVVEKGTLDLWDCGENGKIERSDNVPISVAETGTLNYHGGSSVYTGDGNWQDFYSLGQVVLYAYPTGGEDGAPPSIMDLYSEGSKNRAVFRIAETLEQPDSNKRCEIFFSKNRLYEVNQNGQLTITSGWAEHMGNANPAEYFTESYDYMKLDRVDGEVVVRCVQVTKDGGETVNASGDDGTLTEEQLAPEARPGFVWDGWYTAETGGTKVTTSTVFTEDATIYPRWAECDHSKNTNTSGETTPATCTEPGSEKFTCSACNLAVEQILEPLNHDFSITTWDKDADNHYHKCTRCSATSNETAHTWNSGTVTTAPTTTAEGETTYTCTVCGQTRTEAIARLSAYSVTYTLDEYTAGTAPTQADTVEGKQITLPSTGISRTGYTLAGWALLDEMGTPVTEEVTEGQNKKVQEKLYTGEFTMPGRDVTFQVRWERENYALKPGETIVLEDGTTIKNNTDGTVTIDQDGDGTPETTIKLPSGGGNVTIEAGDEENKDQVVVPSGSTVTTVPADGGGDGPVTTIVGGDGRVDPTGVVEAPAGSTVKDKDGNVITIQGSGGVVNPDGSVTFPPDPDNPGSQGGGSVVLTKPDGTTQTINVPGAAEGVETNGLVPEQADPARPNDVMLPDGTVVTLPDHEGVGDSADGSYTVPGGSVITKTDDEGNKTIITIPDGDEGGTIKPGGGVTVPGGSMVQSQDKDGNVISPSTTVPSGGGTVTPGKNPVVTPGTRPGTNPGTNPGTSWPGMSWPGTSWPGTSNVPNSGSTYVPTISQPEHGKVAVSPANPKSGDRVTVTVTPESGYETGSVTVTDGNGVSIAVTKNADGTYSFTQPAGSVTISAALRAAGQQAVCPKDGTCPIRAFTDASPTAWYHDGVHYCIENGLMSGYGAGVFAPDATLTRGMLAQILYNQEGRPAVPGYNPFADVASGAWYADAVAWAAANGIVGGYGNGQFGPNDSITREQLAVMLYRYAQAKGRDVTVSGNADIRGYQDFARISQWAIPALQWATDSGIVNGKGGGLLDPAGNATRAEAATMLQRYMTSGR